MMVSKKRKVIFLFNPQTGTHTIHHFFKTKLRDELDFGTVLDTYKTYATRRNAHLHVTLERIATNDPEIMDNITEYKIASFYRDPIDRFLSGFACHKKKYSGMGVWHTEDSIKLHDNISIKEYMEIPMMIFKQYPFLHDRLSPHHERFFDGIDLDWTLFNFHDYDNEFVRLGEMFGLNVNKNEIPKKNYSENRLMIDDLTQEEITMIKEYYQPDYEYLESQGIMVPSR